MKGDRLNGKVFRRPKISPPEIEMEVMTTRSSQATHKRKAVNYKEDTIYDIMPEENSREKKKRMKEEAIPLDRCPVCLKRFHKRLNLMITDCDHIFCYKCIKPPNKPLRSCPACKTKLDLKKIQPNYMI